MIAHIIELKNVLNIKALNQIELDLNANIKNRQLVKHPYSCHIKGYNIFLIRL